MVGKPGTAAPLADGLKAAGAAKIYVAESDDADNYLITPYVDVLAALVESATPAACCWPPPPTARRSPAGWPPRIGSGLLVDVVEVKEGANGRPLHLRWRVHRRGRGHR